MAVAGGARQKETKEDCKHLHSHTSSRRLRGAPSCACVPAEHRTTIPHRSHPITPTPCPLPPAGARRRRPPLARTKTGRPRPAPTCRKATTRPARCGCTRMVRPPRAGSVMAGLSGQGPNGGCACAWLARAGARSKHAPMENACCPLAAGDSASPPRPTPLTPHALPLSFTRHLRPLSLWPRPRSGAGQETVSSGEGGKARGIKGRPFFLHGGGEVGAALARPLHLVLGAWPGRPAGELMGQRMLPGGERSVTRDAALPKTGPMSPPALWRARDGSGGDPTPAPSFPLLFRSPHHHLIIATTSPTPLSRPVFPTPTSWWASAMTTSPTGTRARP